jgi:hypothetical protein
MRLRPDTSLTLILLVAVLLGCKNLTGNQSSNGNSNAANAVTNKPKTNTNTETTVQNDDGTIPSGTGTEKEKPAPGKGNVQGKAFFNEQPAVGVEVKLCKTFNRFFGGCKGETFTTKTDDAGEYLIKGVPPGIYEGLTVKVFNSPYYVFATSGYVSAAKYNIEADKTYFAPDTNLFKNDLKVVSPKANAKFAPEGLEVKWNAYPDAAYYKLSIYADTGSGAEPNYDFIGRRVDDVSVVVDKPLTPGSYSIKVESFNANDIKLAENDTQVKISVK